MEALTSVMPVITFLTLVSLVWLQTRKPPVNNYTASERLTNRLENDNQALKMEITRLSALLEQCYKQSKKYEDAIVAKNKLPSITIDNHAGDNTSVGDVVDSVGIAIGDSASATVKSDNVTRNKPRGKGSL